MFTDQYAAVFAQCGKTIPITLLPGANHIGVTLNPPALPATAL